MPKKTPEQKFGADVLETIETLAKNVASKCGHINKQYYNTSGELEDLACDLPKGHAPILIRTDKIKNDKGEISDVPVYEVVHAADYEQMKADIIPPLKQRVEGRQITYIKTTKRAEWLDAAGRSAPQQTPE